MKEFKQFSLQNRFRKQDFQQSHKWEIHGNKSAAAKETILLEIEVKAPQKKS